MADEMKRTLLQLVVTKEKNAADEWYEYLWAVMDITELTAGCLVDFPHSSVSLVGPGKNFHVVHSATKSDI